MMPDSHMMDDQGRLIHIPEDARRIDGLVAEDKVRTLTLFRPGNYAEHPTAPIDIAPRHDRLQGLGTHVKSILQDRSARKPGGLTPGTIELASTHELMRLSGHQRYILLFYENDGKIEIGGKSYDVRRYHTAVEAIFSPDTLRAVRGEYTLRHLQWIETKLKQYEPTPETIRAKQEQFKRYMRHFKPLFGMATHSVKLNIPKTTGATGNKRVQSSMPLPRVQRQLAGEGPYRGRFIQPNYREWYEGETFYGMKLPWFTISTDRIFHTIGDPDAPMDEVKIRAMHKRQARRKAKRVVLPAEELPASPRDQRYAHEEPISTTLRSFDKGMVTIVRQQDNARTISIDAIDAAAFLRAEEVCEQLGGTWLPLCGRWLGDLDYARRVVNALGAAEPGDLPPPAPDHVDELPPVPDVSPMRPSPRNPNLFYFDVEGREAAANLMPKGNWVLMPQGSDRVKKIIHNACLPYAPLDSWDGNHQGNWALRYNDQRESWLVRDNPPELIQRVISAIQQYRE